jgi:sec-independent protein translocase protein TatC
MSTPQNDKPDELAGTEQPFVQHLMELRDRLIKAILALGVMAAALALYPGPSALYDLLAAPLVATLPQGATLIATNVVSPFMVPIKILFMAAFMLALPVVLYQVWAFVAPGLYSHEKRLVFPLVISSTVLFFVGVAFSYYLVLGQVFTFIQSFAPKSITAAPDIEAYLNFVIGMFLAFGLAFEVPVAIILLVRMGVVSTTQLRQWRGYFWVGAAVVTALVTPPDAGSMLMLLAVVGALYEVGIIAAQMFVKHSKAPDTPETTESAATDGKDAPPG